MRRSVMIVHHPSYPTPLQTTQDGRQARARIQNDRPTGPGGDRRGLRLALPAPETEPDAGQASGGPDWSDSATTQRNLDAPRPKRV